MPSGRNITVKTSLKGIYQSQNLATVLTAIEVINMATQFTIYDEDVIDAALMEVNELTGIRGRWELMSSHPTVIYDVGHNEDGITQIVAQLEKDYSNNKKHIILGFVNDKVLDKVLSILPKDAMYYFTNANIPRALPAEDLAALGRLNNLIGDSYSTPIAALKTAHSAANVDDVILVCGSFFIIAELPTMEDFQQSMV